MGGRLEPHPLLRAVSDTREQKLGGSVTERVRTDAHVDVSVTIVDLAEEGVDDVSFSLCKDAEHGQRTHSSWDAEDGI